MSLVGKTQHTLNITELQKFVRLMILLTTVCTVVRIYMHWDNPTTKINTGKTSSQQPFSFQNKKYISCGLCSIGVSSKDKMVSYNQAKNTIHSRSSYSQNYFDEVMHTKKGK